MARRYSGSRVIVAILSLAFGLCFVGFSVRAAMTACGEVVTTNPATGEQSTTYLFEWSACEGTARLRSLQVQIALWGASGLAALATAAVAIGRAPDAR